MTYIYINFFCAECDLSLTVGTDFLALYVGKCNKFKFFLYIEHQESSALKFPKQQQDSHGIMPLNLNIHECFS